MAETYIALQRIDKFLSMPEAAPPVHMRAKSAAAPVVGANPPPTSSSSSRATHGRLSVDAKLLMAEVAAAADSGVMCDCPEGYIELGGADYDWNTNVAEMAVQVSRSGCKMLKHQMIRVDSKVWCSVVLPCD
jgi:hypothetical protein